MVVPEPTMPSLKSVTASWELGRCRKDGAAPSQGPGFEAKADFRTNGSANLTAITCLYNL